MVIFEYFISQRSVAMHLRRGGIFSNRLTANFPQYVPMKEFRESVDIWRTYGQWQSGTYFETQCSTFTQDCSSASYLML